MGIGAGIFLIAAGAILAFALHTTVSGISLVTVGVILMIVGALGIALDLALFAPRRRRVVTTHPGVADYTGTTVRRTTTTSDDVY